MQRKLLSLAALAVAVAAISGIGYAAIPASNGVISACKDSKGTLKVIDAESGQTCNSNQQLLTWNQQGQQGAPGLSGHQIVTDEGPLDSSNIKVAHAFCPSGKVVVGGGAKAFTVGNGGEWNPIHVAITQSYPWLGGTTQGWRVYANETADLAADWQLRAYAICATVQ